MVWGLSAFVVGILFGWGNPGTEDRVHLLKTGTLFSLLLAFGYAMIGAAVGSNPLALGPGYVAGLAAFLGVVALFLTGTWVGDRVEARRRKPVSTGPRGNGP